MNENKGNKPYLDRRKYGDTGVELSVLGLGAIVLVTSDQAHANRVVAEAVERGVNYFDVAPMYGRAQGCEGRRIEDPADVDAGLAAARDANSRGVPFVLDVAIEKHDYPPHFVHHHEANFSP